MIPGTPSQPLASRDARVVWHPYTQMRTSPPPIPIVRGEGVYLFTEDGQRLLDGFSSWWVTIHGHSHPRLNAALSRQAAQLEHVVFASCTHTPAVELAERLISVVPPGLTRVFYSDNGSTAVEVALKLAVQYWGNRGEHQRRRFIALRHAYHGDTVGAMSASEDSIFTRPFDSLLFDVIRAQAPYCYRCPLARERATCGIACLGEATPASPETLGELLAHHGDSIAAVLVEPMLQGAGGMIVWPAEFLSGVRRLCDRYGVLMIADEVLTGFGRTGSLFACEHAAISPDIMCLSKGLTAGYLPLGATVTTDGIYQAFLSDDRTKTFFHGHSFTANPLACAVAVESLRMFEDSDVLTHVRALEGWLRRGLEPLSVLPVVGDVRVLGGVGVLELVSDRATKAGGGYLDDVGPRLTRELLARGLLLRPLGNVLYVMPPYVITEQETAWMIEQIRDVLVTLD
ncbi:MAG: adenosylmethionine--8-amino-7-oxononanoate transaminase [Acidimicrobiia bacterium]|nr:adenosylmethionine--8-amino-7-oxononanoate transaminase [Acidimicrobiia bacterium]